MKCHFFSQELDNKFIDLWNIKNETIERLFYSTARGIDFIVATPELEII